MSGASINERNPFGNTAKAKKPVKNPFQTMNVQQEDLDNDFEPVVYNTGNQNKNAAAPQNPYAQQQYNESNQTQAFYGQPMGGNARKQPFGGQQATGHEVHDISNISGISRGGNQDNFFNETTFISSGSGAPSFFIPQAADSTQQNAPVYDEDNEPPLLEDLGVDLELIKVRTLAVLKFKELDERFAKDADMSGPFIIAMCLGALMLLSGKIHFGYIYGFGLIGTVSIYIIMNLLSQQGKAKLYNTMSILGYCLIPVVILSGINVFINLVTVYGLVLSGLAIIWSTVAATRFFKVLLNLDQQKYLVGYPILLFYLVFVLITIF